MKANLGFAFCGSFCNHAEVLRVYESLAQDYNLLPILSEKAATLDTRFGSAEHFRRQVEEIAGRRALLTIPEVEPLGPRGMLDALVIAPCTGGTLAKLAHAMTDGVVPMAAKSHLRNGRPLILAPASNDALCAGAANLAALLPRRHHYFVPFRQDAPHKKPHSLVADFSLLPQTVAAALRGTQLQPLLLAPAETGD